MIDLKELGITQEELTERVVQKIASSVMGCKETDEDGAEFDCASQFAKALNEAVTKRIEASVNAIADKHVSPNVGDYIEKHTLCETNKWGERHGKPVTFTEYLVARAEAYMTEKVDYEGRAKNERDSYNWKEAGTRISFAIDKHLHCQIEGAMKAMLANANSIIVDGLEKACKIKLQEIASKLEVEVKS